MVFRVIGLVNDNNSKPALLASDLPVATPASPPCSAFYKRIHKIVTVSDSVNILSQIHE